MNTMTTVFAQLMYFLPMYELRKCVQRYGGNYKVRSFSCLDQFLCMAFAQLSYRESLRDIEACLRSRQTKLYHMGIHGKVSRSTLADANENRDWRIYADFAQVLIHIARSLYVNDKFGVELDQTVYALDSTTIDLCLSLFPWARFRKSKGAIKMHTVLDLRGNIPVFARVTDGSVHDVNILDDLITEIGAFYVLDKGYIDFERLYNLNNNSAYFVTRAKSNFQFKRIYSHQVDKSLGLICDQSILLKGFYPSKDYPEKLRRIKYFDFQNNRRLVFLTNNFCLPAMTIANLFKQRWQIELFFKWIKQNLKIKSFYGNTPNAVKTQVCIAISVYVLLAIIKKKLKIEHSLYTFLQLISISIFEKTPIISLFSDSSYINEIDYNSNQLSLFNL